MVQLTAWLCALAAISAIGALPGAAFAQAIDRPADERPEREPFVSERAEPPPLALPPPPPAPRPDRLSTGLTVRVAEIRVEGSSVFSDDELAALVEPWSGRPIDSVQIQALLDAVTRRYVEAGYVSSGAVLPDQDLDGGVLIVRVVEGELSDVVIEGNRWYRDRYLKGRLRAAVRTPVNVRRIEEQLQLLLQEPAIERVRAELRPGERLGQSVLVMAVEERVPLKAGGRVDNDNPPGIGGVRGYVDLRHVSLLGFGDSLDGEFGWSGPGLNSQDVRYELPINGWGTALRARFRRTDSEVVENPFDAANITADTWTVGFGLRHPLIRRPRQQLWLGVMAERRRSTTFLDGDRFSFVPGPENGRADVSVVRVVQDWSWRTRSDVLAVRNTVSIGVDALGATVNRGGPVPDGRFVAWLAQAQWAHRFPDSLLGSQIVARFDTQLASRALLSLEQIAVGGYRTVRGYRRNLLVRDNAVIGSIELRIPVFRRMLGPDVLEFAPFVDGGRSWNVEQTRGFESLGSAGVGLRYRYADRVQAYAYWAGAFRDVEKSTSNIQDNGFHLGLTLGFF